MPVQKTKVSLSKQTHNWLVVILLFVLLSFLLRFRGVADALANLIESDPIKRDELSKNIQELADVAFPVGTAIACVMIATALAATAPVAAVVFAAFAIASAAYAFFEWKDFRGSSSPG